MKTKSLLSFLAAWTIFLALTFFAGPSATQLYAQDEAGEEGDEDKENQEEEDEDKKGTEGDGEDQQAPSAGGGSLIQADVSQGKSTANLQSLSSLNIDFDAVNSGLEASGSSMASVFGSDYAGVAAILSAGGTKQAAIEEAIKTAFSTNAAGESRSRLRRVDGAPTADQLDTIADVALLENLVNFAIDVAAPTSEFAQESGTASGAWENVSIEGLGATIQGIEARKEALEVALEGSGDVATAIASMKTELVEAQEQITATSAFIVSELIADSPVTEKNADGAIDYSNHLNGAVAQKLALDEFFSENADKSLSDLIGATAKKADGAGEATLISTVTATAAAVSEVSKDLTAASPGTAFDFEVAEEVAAAVFTKVEDVRGTGATKAAFATAFDPTAGAGAALAIYDKAEEIKTANPGVKLDSVFSENAGASAVDAIYEVAAADDVVFNADSGIAVLDAFYEMAAEIETEIVAGGGSAADFSTQFKADAGLKVANAIFNTVEDVRATLGTGQKLEDVFSDNAGASAAEAIYGVATDATITFNADSVGAVADAIYSVAQEVETELKAGNLGADALAQFNAGTMKFDAFFEDDAGLAAAGAVYKKADKVRGTLAAGQKLDDIFSANAAASSVEAIYAVADDAFDAAPGTTFDADVAFAVVDSFYDVVDEFETELLAGSAEGVTADQLAKFKAGELDFDNFFAEEDAANSAFAIFDAAEETKLANPDVDLSTVWKADEGAETAEAIYGASKDFRAAGKTFNRDAGAAIADSLYGSAETFTEEEGANAVLAMLHGAEAMLGGLAEGETLDALFESGQGDLLLDMGFDMAKQEGDFAGQDFDVGGAGIMMNSTFESIKGKDAAAIEAEKDSLLSMAGAMYEDAADILAAGGDPSMARDVIDAQFAQNVTKHKAGGFSAEDAKNAATALKDNPDLLRDLEGKDADDLGNMLGSFIDSAKDGTFTADDATFFRETAQAEGPFDPDEFEKHHQLHEGGVDVPTNFEAFSQTTKDKFYALQAKNPEAATRLLDGLGAHAEDEFVDLIDVLDQLSSQQLTDLLGATSSPIDVNPVKPDLFSVADAIMGDMDENNLNSPRTAFVTTVIEVATAAGANANPQLFEKIGDVVDDLIPQGQMSSGIPNFSNALMEAGKLANTLLTGVTIDAAQFGNPQGMNHHYQTRSSLLSNGYNIHVIRLLGKYAFPNTLEPNLANQVADFLENTPQLPGTGQNIQNLRDLFDDQPKNTDVLGARELPDNMPFGKIPRKDPDDYGVIGGKKVEIKGTGNLNLSTYLQATPDLAIGGVEEVHVWTSFTVSGGQKPGTNAGLTIAADSVQIEPGKGIAFDGLYLAVGADDDLSLTNVTLQNDKHIGLASLGNVTLTNGSLLGGHRGQVYVYAQDTLTVDGVDFSSNLSEIYMEAKTVKLSNVDFPYGTDVTLKSQLGGLGGKYPHFSPDQTFESGRVNFLNNSVKYGGTPIIDNASFDAHGKFITIGTIDNTAP